MNKHQYEKYVTSKISKSINEDDKKIYKKRIISITKELLIKSNCNDDEQEEEEKENIIAPDVKYTFEQYIKSCIQYFKLIDNNDVIQEKYKDLDLGLQQIEMISFDEYEDEHEDKDEDKENIIINEIDVELDVELDVLSKKKQEKDNSLWIRSIKMCNPSLDSFVNKKQEY
jgi:hypothetical protein